MAEKSVIWFQITGYHTVSTTVFSLKSSETSVTSPQKRFGRVIFTPQMAPDRKPAKRFPSFRRSPVWSSRPNSCRSKREAWHRLPWSWIQNDAGEKRAAETMEGIILGGILRQFDGASLFNLFGEKYKCHMLGLFWAQEIVLRSKQHAFRPKTKPVILWCFGQAIQGDTGRHSKPSNWGSFVTETRLIYSGCPKHHHVCLRGITTLLRCAVPVFEWIF